MAAPALSVEGGAKLRRTLKRAGLDLQDLKEAHKQIAAAVVREARPDTPNTTGRGTGRLARTLRGGGTARASTVRAGTKAVPYAAVIHWGWPKRGIKANPWISQAAEDQDEKSQAILLDAVHAIIRTVEGTTTP